MRLYLMRTLYRRPLTFPARRHANHIGPATRTGRRCTRPRPSLRDTLSAWAWLRAERANLQAAIDHAGRHDLGPDLITLTGGLATVLYTDGPWPQAISLHVTAAATVGRLGDHLGQAGALTDLGRVRKLTGDYSDATGALTQALQT
jgi:hypothetical protein